MENQIYEIEKVDVKQLETYMKEKKLFPKDSDFDTFWNKSEFFSHIYELEKEYNKYNVYFKVNLPKDTLKPIIWLCTEDEALSENCWMGFTDSWEDLGYRLNALKYGIKIGQNTKPIWGYKKINVSPIRCSIIFIVSFILGFFASGLFF